MNIATNSFLAGLVLAGTVAALAIADPSYPVLPDPVLTPGAVASASQSEVCARVGGLTYTKRHRVWDDQPSTFKRYGVPYSAHRDYEDDDRVPVCLGGDNGNPANHWPQPSDRLVGKGNGYESKDVMDTGTCRMVCEGEVGILEAQSWFLAPDWRDAYRQHFAKH